MWKIFFLLVGQVYASNTYFIKVKKGKSLPVQLEDAILIFPSLYKLSTVPKHIKQFYNHPDLEYIEKNRKRKVELASPPQKLITSDPKNSLFNDPLYRHQWTLNSEYGIQFEKAHKAWGYGSNPIVVAVVDTGVDVTHPDLLDQVWTNENEIPDNGIDDDENGIIDDIHGINTINRSNGKPTANIRDTHGHGTHVSGIIAATSNNKKGILGASKAKIMAIRTVPNYGDETDVNVVDSFMYAAKMGAKIINCSFGKGKNEGGMAVRDTINHIGEKYGVLVVAASGNSRQDIDRNPAYPASFDSENLFVVASTTSYGTMSSFSNYGKTSVDIAAPGSQILSTFRRHSYRNLSGTSMASPAVAGAVAYVLAHFELTPLELKDIFMRNARKMTGAENTLRSGGMLDLYKTMQDLQSFY